MKLTAYQADKGDCLLLETSDGKHRMLVDGGMSRAYREHAAPALAALRKAKKKLDIVYVSHIDQDHIAGVLALLDDEAAWRVHEHQLAVGNATHPEPDVPRPPDVGELLHNSFHDQVGANSGAIEETLATTARILAGAEHPWLQEVAQARGELAASVSEAIRVSNRIKPGQLGIRSNPEAGGKLIMVRNAVPLIRLGAISLRVIGPFPEDLTKLRKDWNGWLRKNSDAVAELRRRAGEDSDQLASTELRRVIGPLLESAGALGAMELALARQLGNRKKVTAPNLASLTFLAEENGERILLTGDAHADDILRGLEHHGTFDSANQLHVDVLKVQHHGSENNIHRAFCDRVTADSYVFCGNGEHENPDLEVLELVFDRRMAGDSRRFKFWFNSSSQASINADGRAHMKKVESLVRKLTARSGSRLSAQFVKGSALRVL